MSSRIPVLILVAVLLTGAAWWTLGRGDVPVVVAAEDYPRGPHGSRLLVEDGLQLEVTIFETGVPPHFRIYPYDNTGTPIAPAAVSLAVELHRLGNRVDRITFRPEADYLLGVQVVEEPHSFDVRVVAEHGGRRFEWAYSSVEGKVQLSDAVLTSTGIEVWTLGPREITTTIELPGQLVADDTQVAHVVPRFAGTIAAITPKIGDRVKQGDVLAVVHSRELADVRSAYLLAKHQTTFARTTAGREEALWKKKISAEQDYVAARRHAEQAALAEATARQTLLALGDTPAFLDALDAAPADTLPRYEVRAPIDGVVLERDATIGEAVPTDAAIFLIGDLSTVLVEIAVDAGAMAGVRLGQTARVQLAGGAGETTARVSYVSPRVDTATRRGTARLALANTDGRWRPGQFVTVHLVEATATVAMAVPVDAIQTFRDWQVVFFRFGDWFEARPVELGRSDGRWVEIRSGLSVGDRYAAANSFAIKAEIGKLGATHDH